MSNDPFSTYSSGLEAPANNAAAITPSDATDLGTVPRALYATGAGTVSVVMRGGATVTLPMLAGVPLPVRVTRVRATGTTATGIVGVW